MGNSETFGVQKGHGKEIVEWFERTIKDTKNQTRSKIIQL